MFQDKLQYWLIIAFYVLQRVMWKQADHVETYTVLIKATSQVK